MNDTIEALRQQLREQANVRFPAAARGGGYPIRFNHCFLRVVYDNVCGAPWRQALPGSGPALERLSEEQLRQALALGEDIIADPDRCRELNRRSLAYRGKLRPPAPPHP